MSPTALGTRPAPSGSSVLGGPGLRDELLRRRSRRRRLVAAGVVALLLVLAAVAAWVVTSSSLLATQQVRVRGESALTAEQVQQAAAVPLGVPLARQDLDAVADRAATLPQVASATAVRDWPHTVTVTVVERRALLAVRQPDGYALVDDQGVAFETRSSVPAGVLATDADPTNRPVLVALATVAAALPDDLRRDVTRASATSSDEITLTTDPGVPITWGDAGESALKAQVVTALLQRSTRAVDVSAPHNPAVR